MGFFINLIGGYKNLFIMIAVAIGIGLLSVAYYRFESAIKQNAVLQQKVTQLTQNVKDKELEIGLLNKARDIAQIIVDQQAKMIEDLNAKDQSAADDITNIPEANQPASPYFSELFKNLGKK